MNINVTNAVKNKESLTLLSDTPGTFKHFDLKVRGYEELGYMISSIFSGIKMMMTTEFIDKAELTATVETLAELGERLVPHEEFLYLDDLIKQPENTQQ